MANIFELRAKFAPPCLDLFLYIPSSLLVYRGYHLVYRGYHLFYRGHHLDYRGYHLVYREWYLVERWHLLVYWWHNLFYLQGRHLVYRGHNLLQGYHLVYSVRHLVNRVHDLAYRGRHLVYKHSAILFTGGPSCLPAGVRSNSVGSISLETPNNATTDKHTREQDSSHQTKYEKQAHHSNLSRSRLSLRK